MRPRRVVVMLELETTLPFITLRDARWWWHSIDDCDTRVVQVQANVVKGAPARQRSKKRR